MPWSSALTQLRDVLAELYKTEADARRIVATALLDDRLISFYPSAVNTWQSILAEAENQARVEAVIAVATKEYPGNLTLLAAAKAYRDGVGPTETNPPTSRGSGIGQPPISTTNSRDVLSPAAPINLFYSYAHSAKDTALRDELEKHLRLLQRQGLISGWHDRMIGAGEEWRDAIDERLQSARIILLLVSPDFLASDYCWHVEMRQAMALNQAGEARVIPVILRPCDWRDAPFGALQALPRYGKPVTKWGNRDEAFLDIESGIRQVVNALRSGQDPRFEFQFPERTWAPTRPMLHTGLLTMLALAIIAAGTLLLARPESRARVAQVLHLDQWKTRIPTRSIVTPIVTLTSVSTPTHESSPTVLASPLPSHTPQPSATTAPTFAATPTPTFTATATPTSTPAPTGTATPSATSRPTLAPSRLLTAIPPARAVKIRIVGMPQEQLNCSRLCFFARDEAIGSPCSEGRAKSLEGLDPNQATIESPVAEGWFRFEGGPDGHCPWDQGYFLPSNDAVQHVPLDGKEITLRWASYDGRGGIRPTITP